MKGDVFLTKPGACFDLMLTPLDAGGFAAAAMHKETNECVIGFAPDLKGFGGWIKEVELYFAEAEGAA